MTLTAYCKAMSDQGIVFLRNQPLAQYTTFRVGGPADILVQPHSAEQVLVAYQTALEMGLPLLIMGNGSNLLVRDGGVRGVVIQIGDAMSDIRMEGTKLFLQAGASITKTAVFASRHALSGFSFAMGIPGTIGGAVFMNAGAFEGVISEVVDSVRIATPNGLIWVSAQDLDFGYRKSRLEDLGIAVEVALQLNMGEERQIRSEMAGLLAKRRHKQPLTYASAGSFFKRPEGDFAGRLIEVCGMRGYQVGGAQVSAKHAGFIINVGHATAKDILDLCHQVQQAVLQHSGIELECEVRIVGEEP